jgi:hypothetical protein
MNVNMFIMIVKFGILSQDHEIWLSKNIVVGAS